MKHINNIKRRIAAERKDAEIELKKAIEDYAAVSTHENYIAVKNWVNICLTWTDAETIILDALYEAYEELGDVKKCI